MDDISFQIQTIKSQIENMKLQIKNIEMQYKNSMNMMMMNNNNQIDEQILNLSIQLLNTGVQAFNTFTKKFNYLSEINFDKYLKQIKNISTQIKSLILDTEQQNQMKQQQIMQQQMMQQQMMQQQMMQQQMMQQMQQQMMQQQMMQQQMNQVLNGELDYNEFIFMRTDGKETKIKVKIGTTIEELLKNYMRKEYGTTKKKLRFLCNAKKINLNDKTEISVFIINNCNKIVVVNE